MPLAAPGNHVIRLLSSASGSAIVSTFIGVVGASGFVNDVRSAALLSYPVGVAVDASAQVYVSEAVSDGCTNISESNKGQICWKVDSWNKMQLF